MKSTVQIAPPYSILDICDPDVEGMLEPSRNHVHWSDHRVRISCLNEYDGNTTVTFGYADAVSLASSPVFDGEIETPSRRVVLMTAHLEIIASKPVTTKLTRVRIWENHPTEPDELVIALG